MHTQPEPFVARSSKPSIHGFRCSPSTVNRISRDPLLARFGGFLRCQVGNALRPPPLACRENMAAIISRQARGTESVANRTAKKSPSLAKRGSRLMRFTVRVYCGQRKRLTSPLSTTSSEQHPAISVKRILKEHGKRSFEQSTNWTIRKMSSRSRQLMVVGTEVRSIVLGDL